MINVKFNSNWIDAISRTTQVVQRKLLKKRQEVQIIFVCVQVGSVSIKGFH